jgi:hypothetical protein
MGHGSNARSAGDEELGMKCPWAILGAIPAFFPREVRISSGICGKITDIRLKTKLQNVLCSLKQLYLELVHGVLDYH